MAGMRRRVPIIGLVVLVALLSGTVFQVRASRGAARDAAEARQEAVRAAAAHAMSLLSLNHRTIDEDMKRVLVTSTGREHERYADGRAALRAATLKNKVVQTGVLRASALESAQAGKAQVLIVADAVIHWEDGKKSAPEERFFRWRMTVTEVSGRWLVSDSELVP
ncbi:hypothetical protein [Sphaerimonospora thailandensis]|uniref:hypothetical protein n=1 Tax=Sphaerimonospora thailandensis TaxID=795644 RepID=UPI00194DF3A3|nr:hypothetical protein [Sphaerimonospora thailandensis]